MNAADSSNERLDKLTDQELLTELTATDLRLESLHYEVQRRMRQRATEVHYQDQREEISRMVEHLEQTKIDWQKVREFFRESIVEAPHPWGSDT